MSIGRSSLTPRDLGEAERSYPRRGIVFFPRENIGHSPTFSQREKFSVRHRVFPFPPKRLRKAQKTGFFKRGSFAGRMFYTPAIIAAGGRPHGGRGIIAPSARIRPEHHPQKNEGKPCRPPVSQPPNRPRRIRTSVRQPPDEKGRPENKPIRLPSGHHPLSARHPRHQSPQQEPIPPGIHAADPPRSHPRRKAGPSHRSGRSTSWKPAKASPPSRPIPRRISGHPQPR